MIETIQVKKRDVTGSRAMIKIREKGHIPAILYGHGEENVCLTVALDTIQGLIKHGTKLVTLTGDVNDTALLRAVQWSSMGDYIIHVDFARVSQTETVEVPVPIHLHGEAPGALSSAGQLRFVTHEIQIRCPAVSIPEFLVCEIGSLQLGQSIHVSELKLPEGATAITPGGVVIVQVAAQSSATEEAAAVTGSEPELIRKEKQAEAGT
ncbi:MAG: 50S ribosomal protein L25 [Planctomycetota bacterium]|jgi:large subunit ribosomal protein L25